MMLWTEQEQGILELHLGVLRGVDKVRRNVATIELHALDHHQLIVKGLVNLFSLQVTSITIETRKNAIVEYLDYQIPVTQREMEICKQQSEIKMRHLPAVDRFKR